MPRFIPSHDDLPERWKTRLRDHLQPKGREKLGAEDFPSGQSVVIHLPDDSMARFECAFALQDELLGEVAIFTEHCRYHIFPAVDSRIEIVKMDQSVEV